MDKLFPKFDSAQADTENNRKRFKEFIQVDLTPDIHGIYCFDDRMGIDSDFSFAFYCNYETSRKIIEKHHLKADTSENSRVSKGLQHDFPWWNKDSIALLPFYSADSGRKLHRNFWYDSLQQKAYYFEYDL
ncbi:MAG: hypothetical protein EP338_08220 [Bacteroidetes bacterium]|nr:MAG: hypothetical protein EP338_08220 [Bacteroidota bacterium]